MKDLRADQSLCLIARTKTKTTDQSVAIIPLFNYSTTGNPWPINQISSHPIQQQVSLCQLTERCINKPGGSHPIQQQVSLGQFDRLATTLLNSFYDCAN